MGHIFICLLGPKKNLFLKIGILTNFFSGELKHNCGEFVQSEETFTGSTQVEARRGSMSELRHQLRPGFVIHRLVPIPRLVRVKKLLKIPLQ